RGRDFRRRVQKMRGILEIIGVDLRAKRGARRAEEQKCLQQSVEINARLESFAAQNFDEPFTVAHIFKQGHVHPTSISKLFHKMPFVVPAKNVPLKWHLFNCCICESKSIV